MRAKKKGVIKLFKNKIAWVLLVDAYPVITNNKYFAE